MTSDSIWQILQQNILWKIVLIAGNSDFIVPIKFACQEGLLVYLCPMGNPINNFFEDIVIMSLNK